MNFKFILAVCLVLIMGSFVTNPSTADVEDVIEARLLSEIDGFDPSTQGEPALQLIAGACQLGRTACAGFIRSLMDVEHDNRYFYSAITVRFGRDVAQSCIGVFTQVLCR
jgi:hypothetical protein